LRQQRERQFIALATIAEQTKIKLSLLEDLEQDNVSRWPTGIFRRAFIRAYAQAIGLDQDASVREFLELYPDPIEVVETAAPPATAANGAPAAGAPPTRLRYIVGSAIDSLSRQWRAPKPNAANEDVATSGETAAPPVSDIDLVTIARLCTDFGRLDDTARAAPLLREIATVLDAVGLIVWIWDPGVPELRPVLGHGYSERVLAQLPKLMEAADNATASAFRFAETCIVRGSDRASGALAVPMMTPAGCIGVFAIELKHGSEQRPQVQAFATIVAAQLARLFEATRPVEAAADRRLA